MKTITCAQMGGTCETAIYGNTPDEMLRNGMSHLESAHPEMAARVKATPKDDPKMIEWNTKFMKDWEGATPLGICTTCSHEHKNADGSCDCACGKK